QVASWLEPLRNPLARTLGAVLGEGRERAGYEHLLGSTVGETVLGDYFTYPDHGVPDIARWLDSIEGHFGADEVFSLAAALQGGAPPHEVIAFGLCALAGWEPKAVATQLAARPLSEVVPIFEAAYAALAGTSPERVRPRLRRLLDTMSLTAGDALGRGRLQR